MSGFPHLFSPLTLRHRTLKSRLVFGAHTANMAEGGLPGERHLGLDLRDGTRQHVAADALVLATVNQPETRLQQPSRAMVASSTRSATASRHGSR